MSESSAENKQFRWKDKLSSKIAQGVHYSNQAEFTGPPR